MFWYLIAAFTSYLKGRNVAASIIGQNAHLSPIIIEYFLQKKKKLYIRQSNQTTCLHSQTKVMIYLRQQGNQTKRKPRNSTLISLSLTF